MSSFIEPQNFFLAISLGFAFIAMTGVHFYLSWKTHVSWENEELKVRSRCFSDKKDRIILIIFFRMIAMIALTAFLGTYILVTGQMLGHWQEALSWTKTIWMVEVVISLSLICCTTMGFSIRGATKYLLIRLAR